MKTVLLSFLSTLFAVSLTAQTPPPGEIVIARRSGENFFYINGSAVPRNNMVGIMASNAEAMKQMRRANTNYVFVTAFGIAGGGLVGYSIGSAFGGQPQWGVGAAGAGVILLAIPFLSAYNKRSRNAVELYNRGLGISESFAPDKPFLTFTGNGVALYF